MSKDRTVGMKSAYELALERLEKEGIERPREDSLSGEDRAEIGELRRKAEAKLAELEILYRDRRHQAENPAEAEEEYLRERRRIEEDRDRKIAALRSSALPAPRLTPGANPRRPPGSGAGGGSE